MMSCQDDRIPALPFRLSDSMDIVCFRCHEELPEPIRLLSKLIPQLDEIENGYSYSRKRQTSDDQQKDDGRRYSSCYNH